MRGLPKQLLIIGIDLAGSEKNRTGVCKIHNGKVNIFTLHKDQEIIDLVPRETQCYIGIDAPLSLPKGRKSINSPGPHFRQCDLELRKLGIKFFPITLGGMRMLTKRGMELKRKIEELNPNAKVFEVFPGALYDFLQIPRKMSKKEISKFYRKIKNILGEIIETKKLEKERKLKNLSQDEIDALACAISVILFLKGEAELKGDEKEGLMIIPTQK